MRSGNQPHILNASSNLLGICLVIVTGLKLTRMDAQTFADEISIFAAVCFMASCVASYISLRREQASGKSDPFESAADYLFLGGVFVLFGAIVLLAFRAL